MPRPKNDSPDAPTTERNGESSKGPIFRIGEIRLGAWARDCVLFEKVPPAAAGQPNTTIRRTALRLVAATRAQPRRRRPAAPGATIAASAATTHTGSAAN